VRGKSKHGDLSNPYTILARKRDEKKLLGRIARREDTNMESGLKAARIAWLGMRTNGRLLWTR
jgi:hypothetical protein